MTSHRRTKAGLAWRYRCVRCSSGYIAVKRAKHKQILVAEFGGACKYCGYDRHPAALEFHHVDPAAKLATVANMNWASPLAKLREEVAKCELVCANCHREIEYGELPEW